MGTSTRERTAVGSGHPGAGEDITAGFDPVLVLPAGVVESLMEVALAIEQTHGDEGCRAVGGLFQVVPGEGTEAAGVDRQGGVDRVFRAEEGDRSAGHRPLLRAWAREIRRDLTSHLPDGR